MSEFLWPAGRKIGKFRNRDFRKRKEVNEEMVIIISENPLK